jgi:hypothetical protein
MSTVILLAEKGEHDSHGIATTICFPSRPANLDSSLLRRFIRRCAITPKRWMGFRKSCYAQVSWVLTNSNTVRPRTPQNAFTVRQCLFSKLQGTICLLTRMPGVLISLIIGWLLLSPPSVLFIGAPRRIQTHNLSVRSRVLYSVELEKQFWCPHSESN